MKAAPTLGAASIAYPSPNVDEEAGVTRGAGLVGLGIIVNDVDQDVVDAIPLFRSRCTELLQYGSPAFSS